MGKDSFKKLLKDGYYYNGQKDIKQGYGSMLSHQRRGSLD
jgi:hypothetical protein